jgi:hypothetical protein
LGGTPISKYFSWRVLIAKLLGLICAQAAGLSLGKEVDALLVWWACEGRRLRRCCSALPTFVCLL